MIARGASLSIVILCAAAMTAADDPTKPPAAPGASAKEAAPKRPAKPLFAEAPTGDYSGPVKTIFTAANAPKTPALEELQLTDTVSQYGITWKFDKKVRAGRFITGDWYFVGPATVVEITPKPLFGKEVADSPHWKLVNDSGVKEGRYKDQWARNGSVLNQRVDTGRGGFDSRICHGHYDPNQFQKLPIGMKPGDSLISTISAPEPIDHRGYGQPVLTAAVLTCMDKPVPADAFRPSYCDRQNNIYLARNLKRELLYTLSRPSKAPVNLVQWARVFERPWLDTVNWGYGNPKQNMPRYGRWMTCGVSHAAILLHLDYPPEDKEPLLVHYVQYGIDLWGIVRAGFAGWSGHGGFGGGRKWSIIFAGLMLGDEDMRSPNVKYPKCLFGEDTQTAFGKSWTGAGVVFSSHPAWTKESPELKPPGEVIGTKAWGRWSSSEGYRRCCTSVEWPGEILSAHLMRAQKLWNHDATFAYMDRWMTEDNVKWAIELRKVMVAKGMKAPWYEKATAPTDALQLELWTKHRNSLPEPKQAGGK
ncbi:MAG TPA: hypothetical protein VNA25_20485 [Phycisphaerae bacterium]|nr:hypothetical protein [Phycisphaerae bacterium]